jgi:hypothetical protein
VRGSKFHTENPQMFSATVQNLVAMVSWHQELCTPASMACSLQMWKPPITAYTNYKIHNPKLQQLAKPKLERNCCIHKPMFASMCKKLSNPILLDTVVICKEKVGLLSKKSQ